MSYKDPEKARARSARYRAAHREESRARARAYAAAHPEERAARQRVYRAAHRDEVLVRQRARYAEHLEEERAWHRAYAAAHPDRAAARNAAHRFGERVPLEAWIEVWHGTCFGCGKTPAEGVDHTIPFSRGGRNVVKNLQPACLPCNKAKRDRPGLSRRQWPDPPRGPEMAFEDWLESPAGRASRIVREPVER